MNDASVETTNQDRIFSHLKLSNYAKYLHQPSRMLLGLAPIQTLAAELNFDDRFDDHDFLSAAASSLMVTVRGYSVYKIQEKWNPRH